MQQFCIRLFGLCQVGDESLIIFTEINGSEVFTFRLHLPGSYTNVRYVALQNIKLSS